MIRQFHGFISHCSTRCLSSSNRSTLDHALRQLLKSGSQPLPRVMKLLPTPFHDLLATVEGGLVGFARSDREKYLLRQDPLTRVNILSLSASESATLVKGEPRKVVIAVLEILKSHSFAHIGGVDVADVETKMNPKLRSIAVSASGSLLAFLSEFPMIFAVEGRRLKLADARTEIVSGTAASALIRTPISRVVKDSAVSLVDVLFSVTPLTQFVALSDLAAKHEALRNVTIQDELSTIPNTIIDCRVFDFQSSSCCYLRLIADLPRTWTLPLTQADEDFNRNNSVELVFSCAKVAMRMTVERCGTNALLEGASEAPLFSVDELLTAVNNQLAFPTGVLLFDRFRHVFDVFVDTLEVRLRREVVLGWLTLSPNATIGEVFLAVHRCPRLSLLRPKFDSVTTPVPLAVRELRQLLSKNSKPVQLAALSLCELVISELQIVFGTENNAELLRMAISYHPHVFVICDENGQSANLSSDNCIATPAMLMAMKNHNVSSASPQSYGTKEWNKRVLAQAIYDSLPSGEDEVVIWTHHLSFLRSQYSDIIPAAELQSSAITNGFQFFREFPDMFSVFELIINTPASFAVGRFGVSTPIGCHPRVCNTLTDALRQIAVLTVGGSTEEFTTMSLSNDARTIIKRHGGVGKVVAQLPQWFEVRAGLITYVGASAEEHDATQKMNSVS